MRYKLLGKSGLRVAELALGTMTFGQNWGWGASKEDSKRIFDAYTEIGGNFIDTANRYTDGTSENYVGEFIASDRERFVVATKYTLFTRRDDVNASGNHRKNLVQSLEGSLKRLKTDYIDLLWVHAWDFLTPTDEVMRGLDDLVSAGKVLYVGISDAPAWVVARANTIAELKNWTPFIGLQIEYSLIQRAPERELLPMANTLGIGTLAWAPMGGGVLSGKYNPKNIRKTNAEPHRLGNEGTDARLAEKNIKIATEVQKIAEEIGCSATNVALNWIRQQEKGIIPIIGARTATQIKEDLECLNFTLDQSQMQRLEEVSKISLGFPHDFLASEGIRDLVYGGFYSSIDKK